MLISEDAAAIFNAMKEGILIIDNDERIVFCNTAYRSFLRHESGAETGNIYGMPLRALRPNAKLPEVLKTGTPILQAPRKEIRDIYFVNMYPIYRDDVLQGGVSVVTFFDDAVTFRQQIEAAELRNRQVLRRLTKTVVSRHVFDYIVAESPKSKEAKELAMRIADSDADILLTSESGTGKEIYAQAIHNGSPRKGGVFVSINCASFEPTMLESELFGYVEGAFPAAKTGGKLGLFEAAAGGTLFLDEISETSPALQSKLLWVLQEKCIRPVGGLEEIPVDVRVIAASNVDLHQYILNGRFRSDLYYRLGTFHISIPSLRERIDDLPALTRGILSEVSTTLKRPVSITEEAMARLMHHSWPGNIRELRNVLEFSAYMVSDGVITASALPENIGRAPGRDCTPLYQRVKQYELSEIKKCLQFYGEDLKGKQAAAKELGISLSSLYSKLNIAGNL